MRYAPHDTQESAELQVEMLRERNDEPAEMRATEYHSWKKGKCDAAELEYAAGRMLATWGSQDEDEIIAARNYVRTLLGSRADSPPADRGE
jgi:hypothetical protein